MQERNEGNNIGLRGRSSDEGEEETLRRVRGRGVKKRKAGTELHRSLKTKQESIDLINEEMKATNIILRNM